VEKRAEVVKGSAMLLIGFTGLGVITDSLDAIADIELYRKRSGVAAE
jgi:hypothetical protein